MDEKLKVKSPSIRPLTEVEEKWMDEANGLYDRNRIFARILMASGIIAFPIALFYACKNRTEPIPAAIAFFAVWLALMGARLWNLRDDENFLPLILEGILLGIFVAIPFLFFYINPDHSFYFSRWNRR